MMQRFGTSRSHITGRHLGTVNDGGYEMHDISHVHAGIETQNLPGPVAQEPADE